jgi:excisionase family DNA binding protein
MPTQLPNHNPAPLRTTWPRGERGFIYAADRAAFAAQAGLLDAYATSGSSPPQAETPRTFHPTAPRAGSTWMTLAEVAEELRVSVRTVMRWVQHGALPAIELPGGTKRVHQATFQWWLASRSTTSLPGIEDA